MKKFSAIFLAVIATLCIAYFFIIDIAIKMLIEQEGSKALRAKLDIDSVTFHLLPASLTLRGVQATNPQQPTTNLVQAEVISLPLHLGDLLARKLIIEQLEIRGLRLARPRAQSGAIAGLTPAPIAAATDAGADAQHFQQQKIAQQRGDLARAQQDLAALRDDWQQRLRALPSSEQLNDFQFRAQSRDANNRARLRADLNEELAQVRKLQEQFALDLARVQPALSASSPSQTGGTVQLPPGTAPSITGALLSQEFTPVLDHLLGFILTGEKENKADNNSLPSWQILARTVVVDGELNLGSTPLQFTGTIENLTPQPRLHNVVTTFTLQSPAQQTAKFSASGSFDYRKLPLHNARLTLTGFPLTQLPLSTRLPLQVTIEEALADIQGLLSVTGNQLDINVIARFQNATLQVIAQDDPLYRSAASTLQNARDFDLKLQASGDVRNPRLQLNSSLDTLLASAVNRELNTVSESAQPLSPETDTLRQLGTELQRMQFTLAATERALQALIDN